MKQQAKAIAYVYIGFFNYVHRVQKSANETGRATGFVGRLQCSGEDRYYLITNQHVLQGRRNKPGSITITFNHKDCKPIKGSELFKKDKQWQTDSGTNLLDGVCCNYL